MATVIVLRQTLVCKFPIPQVSGFQPEGLDPRGGLLPFF